jgi:hypothetical protein
MALALFVPTVAYAAIPTLSPTWTVVPTTVANGDYVAFRASIVNNDTSTVSQLFYVEVQRGAGLELNAVNPSQGTCDTTTNPTFKCTLGQLKPHKTATVVAIFKTPATGTSVTERTAFNTTGLGSIGGNDSSHGDSWPSFTTDTNGNITADSLVAKLNADPNLFYGRYVLNSTLKIVENSQALSNSNPHSTRAYAPVTGIGVTVEDISCVETEPPTTLDPLCSDLTAGFGQISKVNVNNDVDDSGITDTTMLHFYIQLDSSEIPQGVNANDIIFEHVYPGGSETINTACVFAKKATTPNSAPCLTSKALPGGDIGVDIWSFHNGGFKPGLG